MINNIYFLVDTTPSSSRGGKRNEGQYTVSANHEEPEVPPPVQQDPPTADEVTVAATSTNMERNARLTSVSHRGHVGFMYP